MGKGYSSFMMMDYPKQPATLTAGKPWAEMGNREAIEGKDKLKQKKTHGFTG